MPGSRRAPTCRRPSATGGRSTRRWAVSRPIAFTASSEGSVPSASISSVTRAKVERKRSGPAALEGEFARHLMPAVAEVADQRRGRQEDVVEHHLVEMVLAGHVEDRPHRDAGGCACRPGTDWCRPADPPASRRCGRTGSCSRPRGRRWSRAWCPGRGSRHPPPRRGCGVAARSEPLSGSLMPMQKKHSPAAMRGSTVRRCSSVPKRSSVGPLWRSAIQCAATGAPAASISSTTT